MNCGLFPFMNFLNAVKRIGFLHNFKLCSRSFVEPYQIYQNSLKVSKEDLIFRMLRMLKCVCISVVRLLLCAGSF
jgi:hypothetical protein